MRNKALMVAVALAMIASPLSLFAGEQPPAGSPLKAGDRIRIWAATFPKKTVGQVVEATPDLLKLRPAGRPDTVEVPLASVTRLERSLGKHRNVGKSALIGGLIGAGAGVAFIAIAGRGGCEGPCETWALFFGSIGGGAGVVVGAISGAVKTERWETLPVGRVGVTVVPQRDGVGVAMSVRF